MNELERLALGGVAFAMTVFAVDKVVDGMTAPVPLVARLDEGLPSQNSPIVLDTRNASGNSIELASSAFRRDLIDFLYNPEVYDLNGLSFKDYMARNGRSIHIPEAGPTHHGKVIPEAGSVNRPVPTTKKLPGRFPNDINPSRDLVSKLQQDEPVHFLYFVEEHIDNENSTLWGARYDNKHGRWIFNAIVVTQNGNTEAMIKLFYGEQGVELFSQPRAPTPLSVK